MEKKFSKHIFYINEEDFKDMANCLLSRLYDLHKSPAGLNEDTICGGFCTKGMEIYVTSSHTKADVAYMISFRFDDHVKRMHKEG